MLSLTSCKDKNTEQKLIIKESKINRLSLDSDTLRLNYDTVDEMSVDKDANNGTIKVDNNGKILSYGNNGKSLTMGELILTGEDKTEYYIIDNKDIIYDGVRFVGLNEVIESCKSPYEKRNLINFIVKTFNPTHYIIDCTYESDEIDSDNMNSISVNDSLAIEYNNYAGIVNKYGGKKAVWRINLYSDNDMRLRASLVGNDRYIIFRGDKATATIDMAKLEYTKPRFMEIPDYLKESGTQETPDQQETPTTQEKPVETLTQEEVVKLYEDENSNEELTDMFIQSIINYAK